MQVDVTTLSIVTGTVLPILVGIVTKELAHSGLKATLLALLSAVAGAVQVAIGDGGVFSQETIVAAGITWITAVATYYGFLKPTEISPKVNHATRAVGVGPEPRMATGHEHDLEMPPKTDI